MIAGRHRSTTRIFGRPPGWTPDQGECGNLCVADVPTSAGPAMESAWLPTPRELELIAAGAPIVLGILGTVHPPVYLSVGPAPQDNDDGA